MFKNANFRLTFIGFVFALLIFFSISFLGSENAPKGNIIGFVYAEDGTTPLEGAVVKIKHVSTDAVYESSGSDTHGVFKIEGVEKGIYICGVKAAQGDFNSDSLIGVRIHENETAKVSLSLVPYDKKVSSAIKEVNEAQNITGEALVGRAINYNPDTRTAVVFITKGLLQLHDKIHVKGEATDFYQDVNTLKLEGSSVKRLLVGQTASLGVKDPVETGDLIYVVRRKKGLWLFSKPFGWATVISGSSAIVYGIVKLLDDKVKITSNSNPHKR